MITIKEIAKRVGVSIAAVSYALNGKDHMISKETKEKILKIAEETGYVPNGIAQSLLKNKTGVFGVVVSDICNPYNTNFLRCIEAEAKKNNLYVMFGSTENDFDTERETINSFIAKKVDGLIISPGNYYNESLYIELSEYINKRKTPYVMTNFTFPSICCNHVVVDLQQGAYKITEYLINKGYKNITFAGGFDEHYYTYIRYRGFLKALSQYNLQEAVLTNMVKGYDYQTGLQAAISISSMETMPEAVVAVNDLVAYGIIDGLQKIGLKVPQDIGVTGFDNVELPVPYALSLTTMEIPINKMAQLCVSSILNESSNQILNQYTIIPEIFEGETVR